MGQVPLLRRPITRRYPAAEALCAAAFLTVVLWYDLTWTALQFLAVSVSVPLLLFVLLADRVLGWETMGGADIKLFAALGLHFSLALMLMLLIFACVFGILFALAGKKGRGTEFPFGPAIALSAWTTLLIGQPLLNWYLSLF